MVEGDLRRTVTNNLSVCRAFAATEASVISVVFRRGQRTIINAYPQGGRKTVGVVQPEPLQRRRNKEEEK